MTTINTIKSPADRGDNAVSTKELIKKTSEVILEDLHDSKPIFIGAIKYPEKQLEVKLQQFPYTGTENKEYGITIGDKMVDFYEVINDSNVLVGGRTIRGIDDIDMKDNVLYIWDQYKYWEEYAIKKNGDKVDLVISKKTKYNPLRSVEKVIKDKYGAKFTIIEYTNPSTSRGGENGGKMMICHDYYGKGKDLEIMFPHKAGVVFDENSITLQGHEIWIYGIDSKLYRYEISIGSDELGEKSYK